MEPQVEILLADMNSSEGVGVTHNNTALTRRTKVDAHN